MIHGLLVGVAFNTKVTGCYNKASITSTTNNSTTGCGGLIGNTYRNAGTMVITDCTNFGVVNANMTSATTTVPIRTR